MERLTAEGKASVVAFLGGSSLRRQLNDWGQRAPARRCAFSNATMPEYVRAAAREVDVALIDATACPGEALEVSALLAERLGASSVAVYTETLHEGLEVNVRQQGSWLLFGPLGESEWDELLDRMARIVQRTRKSTDVVAAQTRQAVEPLVARPAGTMRRYAAGVRRRRTHA